MSFFAVHRALLGILVTSVLFSPSAFAEAPVEAHASDSLSTTRGSEPSRGAEPVPASKQAIALGHAGLKLLEAGEYEQALTFFEQAEQLVHSPVFLIHQARAAWWLGRYHAALALYQKCSEEPLNEQSPTLWQQAVAEARREWARLHDHMPQIELSFAGDVRAPLHVTIERKGIQQEAGAKTSSSDWPSLERRVLQLDPGDYLISVRDGAKRAVQHSLRAQPDRRTHVHFEFAATKPANTLVPVASPAPQTSALRWGAYAAWSSGTVLLVGGVVTGSMAMMLAQDVRSKCLDNVCPAEEQLRVERALRLSGLAAAGLVSGLVGEVAGTVLWLLDRRENKVRLSTHGAGLALEGQF